MAIRMIQPVKCTYCKTHVRFLWETDSCQYVCKCTKGAKLSSPNDAAASYVKRRWLNQPHPYGESWANCLDCGMDGQKGINISSEGICDACDFFRRKVG